jgi:hypothetical protein
MLLDGPEVFARQGLCRLDGRFGLLAGLLGRLLGLLKGLPRGLEPRLGPARGLASRLSLRLRLHCPGRQESGAETALPVHFLTCFGLHFFYS